MNTHQNKDWDRQTMLKMEISIDHLNLQLIRYNTMPDNNFAVINYEFVCITRTLYSVGMYVCTCKLVYIV